MWEEEEGGGRGRREGRKKEVRGKREEGGVGRRGKEGGERKEGEMECTHDGAK